MKVLSGVLSIALVVLLLGSLFFIVQPSRDQTCTSPTILFMNRKANQPETIVRQLISNLGGLPKTSIDIYEIEKLKQAGQLIPVYPIDEWQVKRSFVSNNDSNLFLDKDPTYLHKFVVDVAFADGDTAVLEWSSWSYGFTACPFLISMGSGPPGKLKLLP